MFQIEVILTLLLCKMETTWTGLIKLIANWLFFVVFGGGNIIHSKHISYTIAFIRIKGQLPVFCLGRFQRAGRPAPF